MRDLFYVITGFALQAYDMSLPYSSFAMAEARISSSKTLIKFSSEEQSSSASDGLLMTGSFVHLPIILRQ